MNAERLLKLADFLWNLPDGKFDFTAIVSDNPTEDGSQLPSLDKGCGAQACAIGWAPAAFPNDLCWESMGGVIEVVFRENPTSSSWNTAREFFDLDMEEADYLFMPNGRDGVTPEEGASAKEVAAHIRDFVKVGMRDEVPEEAERFYPEDEDRE